MHAKSIILPEADQEIADAYHWYERRGQGLGKDFLRCFDAAMADICQAPKAYAKAFEDFRHLKIRRFPYTIYYEFTGGLVIVYAVYHASQDPAALQEKLRQRKPLD